MLTIHLVADKFSFLRLGPMLPWCTLTWWECCWYSLMLGRQKIQTPTIHLPFSLLVSGEWNQILSLHRRSPCWRPHGFLSSCRPKKEKNQASRYVESCSPLRSTTSLLSSSFLSSFLYVAFLTAALSSVIFPSLEIYSQCIFIDGISGSENWLYNRISCRTHENIDAWAQLQKYRIKSLRGEPGNIHF